MTTDTDPATASWHLDKRVPVALIIALTLQAGGLVWWGATTSARLGEAERSNAALAVQVERYVSASSDQSGRLVKVETQLGYVQQSLEKLDGKIDKLIEKTP